jgi:ATP-dependent helicase HrpA
VAGEVVETSQLFIRTLAGIEPEWIYELAPHCCKVAHQHPRWDAKARRVIADEVVTFQGLEVQRKRVAYGNVNPAEAAVIFIRAALVESADEAQVEARKTESGKAEIRVGLMRTSLGVGGTIARSPYRFLEHNRAVRAKIESWQTRTRHHGLMDLDQAFADFYAARLGHISSFDELNRLLRDKPDQEFLCASVADVVGDMRLDFDSAEFPEAVELAGQPLPVRYAYAPGEDWDGVTVQLPLELARSLSGAALEWSVPGLRTELVSVWLRSLPKALRRELQPLEEKVVEIVSQLQPTSATLAEDLGRFIRQKYGVLIPADAWRAEQVPAHLRPRVEVLDAKGKAVAASRDLSAVQDQVRTVPTQGVVHGNADWRRAAAQWEKISLSGWTFGDLPERITVAEGGPAPVYAWPGLALEEEHVSVRLFRSAELAREAGRAGLWRLLELGLQKDLAWLQKDLRSLAKLDALYAPIGASGELAETAFAHLKRHAFGEEPLTRLAQVEFEGRLATAKSRLVGTLPQLTDQLSAILTLRQQIANKLGLAAALAPGRPMALKDLSQLGKATSSKPAQHPLQAELAGLLPARFLETTNFDRLPHLVRYLKALALRVERAALNPMKDKERARQLAPFVEALRRLQAASRLTVERERRVEEFRWMVEEFKVSLFAQELGTAVPVSAKRLEQFLVELS